MVSTGVCGECVNPLDSTFSGGGLDGQRIMFYNTSSFRGWQLVEEEMDEAWSPPLGSPGSVDERRAYVWGARYIDDLIQTLVDGHDGASPDGDYEDVAGGMMPGSSTSTMPSSRWWR